MEVCGFEVPMPESNCLQYGKAKSLQTGQCNLLSGHAQHKSHDLMKRPMTQFDLHVIHKRVNGCFTEQAGIA